MVQKCLVLYSNRDNHQQQQEQQQKIRKRRDAYLYAVDIHCLQCNNIILVGFIPRSRPSIYRCITYPTIAHHTHDTHTNHIHSPVNCMPNICFVAENNNKLILYLGGWPCERRARARSSLLRCRSAGEVYI